MNMVMTLFGEAVVCTWMLFEDGDVQQMLLVRMNAATR